ncbi:hypothetical protein N7478_009423 [Penicillium angulare]|uniref:uncharacterized protein n=1 Tax=Penicillium angulare TaxID=116970 RepID=UPI002541794B|nr:uncharacterized protein N7478_009423 [Penicillium angulare]KAJ5266615.1 hypothetical protein N7478_009423 [Penicillium angulare]
MDPPRNRKQRRAAATNAPTSAADIPLSLPPRDDSASPDKRPKKLVDIIAERQNALFQQQTGSQAVPGQGKGDLNAFKSKGTRFVTVDASGALVETDADIHSDTTESIGRGDGSNEDESSDDNKEDEDENEETDKPLPPLIDTILLALPLTTLHLTLAYLAAHQYAEVTDIPQLIRDAVWKTFPLLTLLIHFLHGHIFSLRLPVSWGFLRPQPVPVIPFTADMLSLSFLRRLIFPPTIRTIIFLPTAVLLGIHVITVTNEEAYYAVMKKAPAYATVWIWCLIEMSTGAAVVGALCPFIYGVWWKGHAIF